MATTLFQNSMIQLGSLEIDPRTVSVAEDTDALPYHFLMDSTTNTLKPAAVSWDTVFQDVTYRHVRHPADASDNLGEDGSPGDIQRWQATGLPTIMLAEGKAGKGDFDDAHRNCIINMVDYYLKNYVAIGGDGNAILSAPSSADCNQTGLMNATADNLSNLDVDAAGGASTTDVNATNPVNNATAAGSLLQATIEDLVPTWNEIMGAAAIANKFSVENTTLGAQQSAQAVNAGMDGVQIERLVEFWGTAGHIYSTAAVGPANVRDVFPQSGMGDTLPLKKVNFVTAPSLSCTYEIEIDVDRSSVGDSTEPGADPYYATTFTDKTFAFTQDPQNVGPTANTLCLRVKYD